MESNINQLEHKGLNIYTNRGFHGFKRDIVIGIITYNLHRIGKELLKKEVVEIRRKKTWDKMMSAA